MKIKKNDRWKGILVLLILLFIFAKDQIMSIISPCENGAGSGSGSENTSESENETVPNNTISFPTPTFNPEYSKNTESINLDAEKFERGEDKDVRTLSKTSIVSAFDPVKDQLMLSKTYGI